MNWYHHNINTWKDRECNKIMEDISYHASSMNATSITRKYCDTAHLYELTNLYKMIHILFQWWYTKEVYQIYHPYIERKIIMGKRFYKEDLIEKCGPKFDTSTISIGDAYRVRGSLGEYTTCVCNGIGSKSQRSGTSTCKVHQSSTWMYIRDSQDLEMDTTQTLDETNSRTTSCNIPWWCQVC